MVCVLVEIEGALDARHGEDGLERAGDAGGHGGHARHRGRQELLADALQPPAGVEAIPCQGSRALLRKFEN